jgi:ADP-ribosylglycohydrolase
MPVAYAERVYAGVLGKAIGVYLGRPIEGWPYERIVERFGSIVGYVNADLGVPIVVADDDLTGTFTFIRAIGDSGRGVAVDSTAIADAWLNYVVDGRTCFWWGGVGISTEHTAYKRLRDGVRPPASGSSATNGRVLAEQIGAQIFIDAWALVSPGRPKQAAELARRAARVSHDGEAVYAAQAIAAMEAEAFVTEDINRLLDTGLEVIPSASTIHRLISDLRTWHADEPDWRATRERFAATYPDASYPGACHVVPNHGRIILALLYGDGDFRRSLSIVNTCGFDTDCNSGNVGCLLGIRNGLSCFDAAPDLRDPVRDRLILPNADGGSVVTDALREALALTTIGCTLSGTTCAAPKDGARFSFALPGAVQGFSVQRGEGRLANVVGPDGDYVLEVRCHGQRVEISTPTFAVHAPARSGNYEVIASPTLDPGQLLTGTVGAPRSNRSPVSCSLLVQVGATTTLRSPPVRLQAGENVDLCWRVPATRGFPIAHVGFAFEHPAGESNAVFVDRLDWKGAPNVQLVPVPTDLREPLGWVDAVDAVEVDNAALVVTATTGRGHLLRGSRDWGHYEASASIDVSGAVTGGIAVGVQGLRRYYALLVARGKLTLVKRRGGDEIALWEAAAPTRSAINLGLALVSAELGVRIGDERVASVVDPDPLGTGGVGVLCEEGSLVVRALRVRPVTLASDSS